MIRGGSLTASAGARGAEIPWPEIVRLIKTYREQALDKLPYDAEGLARVTFTTLWPTVDHEIRPRENGPFTIESRPSTDAAHALEARGRLLAGPAADVFGHASVYAAARPLADGCRWCAARAIAERLRALPPVDKPEYRALFGQEPCEADRRVFTAWDRHATQRRREQATTEAGKSLRLQALSLAELKIGTPYKLNAIGPTAFDCAGLVQWAYAQAAGVDVPRTREALLEAGDHVPVEQAQPGDLLFQEGAPNHVAIVADGDKVIHAVQGGVAYAPITAHRWTTALRLGVTS
ncbi:C40 family peptidase [Streptomyces sp. NPDC090075]|uniref:C40 family peptidase n=1 Tax=Streptomyces sp. NPDC090075 TaxID=3365937 RepID=UPI0038267115